MLNALVFAFSQDLLVFVGKEKLFDVPVSQRPSLMSSALGASYPQALREYLADVSEADFAQDMTAFIAIMTDHRQTATRAERFREAVRQALIGDVAAVLDGGAVWEAGTLPLQAAQVMQKVISAGRSIELGREIQRFLLVEHGTASPTVQTAQPLAPEERAHMRARLLASYPGSFPLFESEASLGGGIRCFYRGSLQDESWMARATRTFAGVRAGRL